MSDAVTFELKGGRHIDSNVRKRVAEKNVEAIPKIQKNILSALDIAFIILQNAEKRSAKRTKSEN